jgi:hypothetical protein
MSSQPTVSRNCEQGSSKGHHHARCTRAKSKQNKQQTWARNRTLRDGQFLKRSNSISLLTVSVSLLNDIFPFFVLLALLECMFVHPSDVLLTGDAEDVADCVETRCQHAILLGTETNIDAQEEGTNRKRTNTSQSGLFFNVERSLLLLVFLHIPE